MCKPNEARARSDARKKPAATKEFRLSPTLIRAVPSHVPRTLSGPWRVLAWVVGFLAPSVFIVGPLMLISPPFLFLFTGSTTLALRMLLLNVLLLIYPHKPWPWFRRIFQLWFDLFEFHHNLMVDANDPTKADATHDKSDALLMCAMHPHGIIPIQAFLWMAWCDQYLPNHYGFGATTDMALRVPLLRQVLLWGTSTSATSHVLRAGLNSGTNLYILPGGVAEIFMSTPGTHAIKARRRGLMKLALQTGAGIVPVYVFGGNDFYHQMPPSLGGSMAEKVSRTLGAGMTLFWGQWGLPVPYPVKCSMVLGDTVFPNEATFGEERSGSRRTCRKVANPSIEQIDELLDRYRTLWFDCLTNTKSKQDTRRPSLKSIEHDALHE